MKKLAFVAALVLASSNCLGWNYFKPNEIKEGAKEVITGPSPNAFKMERIKGADRLYMDFDGAYTEEAKAVVLSAFKDHGFFVVENKDDATVVMHAKNPLYEWNKKGELSVNNVRLFEMPQVNTAQYLSSKGSSTIDSIVKEGAVHALIRKLVTTANEGGPFMQIVRVEFEVEGEKYSDRSVYGNRKFTASAGVSDSDVRSGIDDLFKSAVICAVECER